MTESHQSTELGTLPRRQTPPGKPRNVAGLPSDPPQNGMASYGIRVPKLWSSDALRLQPHPPASMMTQYENERNYSASSCVDILQISRSETTWVADQGDKEIESLLQGMAPDRHKEPTLVAFFVTLDDCMEATYEFQASISKVSVHRIFNYFQFHDGFLPDLLGKPNYWSAVWSPKVRDEQGRYDYEFFCQHPRWIWANKARVYGGGHRSPCSVLMKHSELTNTSAYIIVSDKRDDVARLIRGRLHPDKISIPQNPDACFAESPFTLHATVAGITFEQSISWVKNLRELLMIEIKRMNNFTDSGDPGGLFGNRDQQHGAKKLEVITDLSRKLHLISQYADSGIANAKMSIMACQKMSDAFEETIISKDVSRSSSLLTTRESLCYIFDSFHSQQNWLVTYKNRKDAALNFVLNLLSQENGVVNIEMAHKMSHDSSSMHAITILTLIFLPGTFVSTFLSTPAFVVNDSGAPQVTIFIWPLLGVGLLLSLVAISAWYYRNKLSEIVDGIMPAWTPLARKRQRPSGVTADDSPV